MTNNPAWAQYLQRISLQWRLMKAWVFVQRLVHPDNKGKIKAPHNCPSVRGPHQWPVASPQKGPLIQKRFSCHDVIIFSCYAGNLCSYFQSFCSVLATQMEMSSPWNFQWECHQRISWKRFWKNICEQLWIYIFQISMFSQPKILRFAQDEQITPFDVVLSY